MELISRQEAKEKGLNKYYTGKLCPQGHMSERYVSDKSCIACRRDQDHIRDEKKALKKQRVCFLNSQKAGIPLLSREAAKEQGLKFYFNGIPCQKGHLVERYTATRRCVICSKVYTKIYHETHKAKLQKYLKEYQLKNKVILAKKKKTYQDARKPEILAYAKEYRKENAEKINKNLKQYRIENPEKIRAMQKLYRERNPEKVATAKRKYYQDNKKQIKVATALWRKNNPEKHAASNRGHLARKKGADGSHTIEDWHWLCDKFDNRCWKCGKKIKLSVDHIHAPALGGSDYIQNIQPLCISCNSSKNQKIISYLPDDTFLLYPSTREAM